MQEAIKLAIEEGGWLHDVIYPDWTYPNIWTYDDHYFTVETGTTLIIRKCNAEITSDPLFWSSLGKALGWTQYCPLNVEHVDIRGNVCTECGSVSINQWQGEWHNFIDHLASGKDAESFFKNLISNNK